MAHDILVVDQDPGVRAGLGEILADAGLEVTDVPNHDRARDQLSNRFFAAMLVDLDGPRPEGGLELVHFARQRSPLTAVIVLSGRRTFDAVAAAFRAGAFDVVPKTDEHLPYLRARVLEAVRRLGAEQDRSRLLDEVTEVHERFLAEMVTLFRQVTELEERRLVDSGDAPADPPLELLVVDDSPAIAPALRDRLTAQPGWRVRLVASGGAALDAASQEAPQILVVRDGLPDLPASLLVKTVRTATPDAVALVYRLPTRTATTVSPGEVKLFEQSHAAIVIPSFDNLDQLVAALEDLKEVLPRKARERKQLAAFRKQHADFLKLWNGLRQRLAATPPPEPP